MAGQGLLKVQPTAGVSVPVRPGRVVIVSNAMNAVSHESTGFGAAAPTGTGRPSGTGFGTRFDTGAAGAWGRPSGGTGLYGWGHGDTERNFC